MVQKLPPPPNIANVDPAFNRWLVELTAILGNSGGVNPNTIDGYPQLVQQVDENTTDVNALQSQVTTQALQINTLINGLALANASITTLSARSQVFNGALGAAGTPSTGLGVIGDWFANTTGNAGFRIFIKTGVATWTAFPF